MSTVPLGPFRGIDARPGAADQPGGLIEGKNVVVNADGALVRRPVLVWRAACPADSKGIYASGDQLRTLAPYNAGDLTADDPLMPTLYVDYITDPSPKVLKEILGVTQGSDGRTVVLVRFTDNSTALHRCNDVTAAPAGSTLAASLGFTPDFSLIGAAGRTWALEGGLRKLWYSKVEGDANESARLVEFTGDEDLAGGPGFINVAQFAQGVGGPQVLGKFGDRLVVFYRSALLIYRIDVDKARFFLEGEVKGPGTSAPRSVAAVGPDTLFLSDDGVSVMSTVVKTLDAPDDGISGRINHLAKQYAANLTITPVAHYARTMGCYLLAFGQDVLCLSLIPGSRIMGWTRWRLPVAVDAWAEAAGKVWVRSGVNLYSLSDDEDNDETASGVYVPVPVLVQTLPIRGTKQGTCLAVAAASTEPVAVQVVCDGRPGVDTNEVPLGSPAILPPRAPEPAHTLCGKVGRTFAMRVYDAGAAAGWRLDDLWLDLQGGR